ncbi:MAG: lipoyl synthase [Nitrospinota bacterium]
MGRTRFPPWLIKKIPSPSSAHGVRRILRERTLHTVCEEARCPNLWECFARPTATFMILGSICTRNCGFCAVTSGTPAAPDPAEPRHVAEAAAEIGLKHVVITSVTRDDLPDGGAGHFAATVRAVKEALPGATVEVLTPDFGGSLPALETVLRAGPHVYNHNLETVPRLYPRVRPAADYSRSLELLSRVSRLASGMATKSGLMVGLGEREDEVLEVMADLRAVGCGLLTIGQYLQPTRESLSVEEFVAPERFQFFRARGEEMGFSHVASGPFVRSSFNAEEFLGQSHARVSAN